MNVAQPRRRRWSPVIILFSIILHAVVFYYIAVAFKVLPPPAELIEPRTIEAVRYDPPPPMPEPERVVKELPRFQPHQTLPSPEPVAVQRIPAPAQPAAESTANATVIALDRTIEEQPVSQALPAYPRYAQEHGIEGRVIMSITIMPDGTVRDVRVVDARPRGQFESAAVRAVQTWRYRPSNVTRTNVIVHMDFELRDA